MIHSEKTIKRMETARSVVAAISARKRRIRLLAEALTDTGITLHGSQIKNLLWLEEKARKVGVEVKD